MSDATPPGPPPFPDQTPGAAPPPPPPPPPPSSGPGAASSNRGIMIVLSYLWLLALVPLLVEKDDKDVQWHAKHGIVLMAAEIVAWIVFAVFSSIVGYAVPLLGCFTAILWFGLAIGIVVLHVMCIVKGLNGQRFLIPGLSDYANRF